MKIPVKFNLKNKFAIARVHYSVDPEKNIPQWLEKAKTGISDKSWLREYEISYETFDGKPVYGEFTDELITSFDYTPGMVEYLYRGWDFGYHHPAMVVAWMNKAGQFCVHSEILGKDEGIKDFGTRCLRYCQNKYPNAKWLEACDPAGHQKSDKADFTSIQVLNSMGIYPVSKASAIEEGLEILRQRMKRRNDGKFGFMIHPDCTILINALKGGYRYAELKEGQTKEEPLKDGYFDHLSDSLRYISVNFMEVAPTYGTPTEVSITNSIMNEKNQWSTDEFLDF